MPERYSITRLRADLYRVLDEVLETGVPVEVERRGKILRISPVERGARLARLEPHPDYLCVDSESIVHLDWSGEWSP